MYEYFGKVFAPPRKNFCGRLRDHMANKNFLARGIQRNETPESVPKLMEPRVVAFGYRRTFQNSIVEKNDKWQAESRSCRSVTVESRRKTSGFVR